MDPLQAATSEELLDELGRRFTACLFVAEKRTPGEDDETTTMMRYSGSINAAIGMASRTASSLLRDATDSWAGDDEGDDPDNGH